MHLYMIYVPFMFFCGAWDTENVHLQHIFPDKTEKYVIFCYIFTAKWDVEDTISYIRPLQYESSSAFRTITPFYSNASASEAAAQNKSSLGPQTTAH